jgi:hypothetical protein
MLSETALPTFFFFFLRRLLWVGKKLLVGWFMEDVFEFLFELF